jgi:Zn-dependent protease with chaperone function
MNFFEHQTNARRQTGRLLVYFLAAVAATVLAVNTGTFLLARVLGAGIAGSWLWHEWSLQILTGTLMVIIGGSLIEYLNLRGGGKALAEMLGARRIDFATTDLRERQFINVVAEMAIASGTPAPMLYVMDREPALNAFVAGLDRDSTVMVLTAGALEAFDRSELQAVVGHEFSHILHGDMRLNVRLMALLAGILALGQLGSFLMRMAGDSGSRSRGRNKRGGIFHLFAFGLLLWLIGAIGLFFSRLIKAAISRQREFLADASSVQFTRNPDGLAEALLKIRNHSGASWLQNMRAESMSHMCFAETLTFSSWFDTHPPLEQRIAAMGKHYLVRDRARQREQERQVQTAGEVAAFQGLAKEQPAVELPAIAYVAGEGLPGAGSDSSVAITALTGAALLARAGTVTPRELDSAQALHRRLPAGVKQALESSEGARALIYTLVARQSVAPQALVQNFLKQHEPGLQQRIEGLCRITEGLDFGFALPLTELALPRLQLMDAKDQQEFLARLRKLAQLDRRLSTFEFALLMLLRKQLHLLPRSRPVRLPQCRSAVAVMVAVLLRTGGMAGEKLQRSYARMMRTVFPAAPDLPAPELSRLPLLAKGLLLLGGLPPQEKKLVLELAATAVLADAEVRLEEYELLRVIAGLLDCPMPLLDL